MLDDPESYEELSASCGIAAAMVKNDNPLHVEYVAEGGIPRSLENITADGRVLNVSGGTAVMNDLEGYRQHFPHLDAGLGAGACTRVPGGN